MVGSSCLRFTIWVESGRLEKLMGEMELRDGNVCTSGNMATLDSFILFAF